MPVVSATQEVEVGESLEPGRWRLQREKNHPTAVQHGNRVRFCLKKTNKKHGTPKTQHSMLERMSISPPISPYILCLRFKF